MALPKVHRLRQRRDFSTVYQKGLRRSTPHLILRGMRQPRSGSESSATSALPPTQIGISISQKVSKRAVRRNRIRRQLHACFRQLLPNIAAGWRLVVVVQPSAIECDYGQFLQELKQLLRDAEVLHGDSRGDLL